MDLVEALHSERVVDAGVQSDLVDNGDAGVLCGLLESTHVGSAVRGRHHVGLVLDAGARDHRMEGVREQRDDNIRVLNTGATRYGQRGMATRFTTGQMLLVMLLSWTIETTSPRRCHDMKGLTHDSFTWCQDECLGH